MLEISLGPSGSTSPSTSPRQPSRTAAISSCVHYPAGHRANDGVQTRTVAASGEDPDPSHSASLQGEARFREVRTGYAPENISTPTCPIRPPARAGRTPSAGPTGRERRPSTRTHKLVNLAGIILPLVGLVIAIVVLWERMVGPTRARDPRRRPADRAGRATDPRLFTHRSFETYSRCSLRVRRPRRDGRRGRRRCLGLVPSEAPPFSDVEGGDPHSPHVGYGEGSRSRCTRALACPFRLAPLGRRSSR